MTLLAPLFALAGLAAIPIVVLYLLKMKRQERVVPSTLLWQQAIRDLEANTPFQKLRANLLLILQLLALAVLVFALMRPTLASSYRLADRGVLVIDTSASMLARDADGDTRFDRARELAEDLIDGLEDGQRMAIFAGREMVTNGFTADARRLHGALDDIEPAEAEVDMRGALQLAASALAAAQEADREAGRSAAALQGRVYLVSDGAAVELPDEPTDLADHLTYYAVAAPGDTENAGITGLQFRRPANDPERGELFVNVVNYGRAERELVVSLRPADADSPIDAQRVTLRPGQGSGVTFDHPFGEGRYVVELDGEDALPVDDRVYLVVAANRPLRVVLVSPGNAVLEQFLASEPYIEAVRATPEDYEDALAAADLLMFDGFVPEAIPQSRTAVFITPRAAAGPFKPTGMIEQPEILDFDREDAVMRFVNMQSVRLGPDSTVCLADDPRIVPLVWSADATLVGYATTPAGVRHYCVAFDVRNSRGDGMVSMLFLLDNILIEARRVRGLGQALVGPTGRLWELHGLADGETVTVETPDGRTQKFTAAGPVADFADTRRAGVYEARTDAGERAFALNLLSPRESNIAPKSELVGLAGETVSGRSEVVRGRREIWTWAALAALGFLMLEWFAYHRRIA